VIIRDLFYAKYCSLTHSAFGQCIGAHPIQLPDFKQRFRAFPDQNFITRVSERENCDINKIMDSYWAKTFENSLHSPEYEAGISFGRPV